MSDTNVIPKDQWQHALTKALQHLNAMHIIGEFSSDHVQIKGLVTLVLNSLLKEGEKKLEEVVANKLGTSTCNGVSCSSQDCTN